MTKSIVIGLVSFILGGVASYYAVVRVEHLPQDHPIIYHRYDDRIILCEVLHNYPITNVYHPVGDPNIRHDAIELKSGHKGVFEKIDGEVEAALADHPHRGDLGFVHIFWQKKRDILREQYGIEWRPPSELNPTTSFD